MKIDNKIIDARKSLRKLYMEYTDEFHKITTKIDKYLEALQEKDENSNK